MPKIKTHRASAKVFKKRKNDIKIGKPGSRHNTGSKSSKSRISKEEETWQELRMEQ